MKDISLLWDIYNKMNHSNDEKEYDRYLHRGSDMLGNKF